MRRQVFVFMAAVVVAVSGAAGVAACDSDQIVITESRPDASSTASMDATAPESGMPPGDARTAADVPCGVCSPGLACVNGACTPFCPVGQTLCGSTCTVLATDTANCGGCGHGCPLGASCNGGTCNCPGDDVACGGSCTNLADDPANCGSCAHDCQGSACVGGECQPVVVLYGTTGARAIAVDSANVYIADPGVVQVPLDGGTPITLGSACPAGITFDSTTVYWADPCLEGVFSAPIGAANHSVPTTLYQSPSYPYSGSYPNAVQVDGTSVYWSDGGGVYRMPKTGVPDGGAPQTLASESVGRGLAADGSSLYWWSDTSGSGYNGDIHASPKTGLPDGGAPRVVVSNVGAEAVLTADGTNVYWAGTLGSDVMQAPAAGGGAPVTIASNRAPVGGIACDGSRVYWTVSQTPTGRVMSVPVSGSEDGGAPQVLAAGQDFPRGIALTPTMVFWVDQGLPATGLVQRVAK